MHDVLEPRRFLAAILSGGTLSISGTSGNDLIDILLDHVDGQYDVSFGGSATSFSILDVERVRIFAGDGNDEVVLTLDAVAAPDRFDEPVTIYGGNGNDRISLAGGRDFCDGEGFDDRIYGGPGPDFLIGGSASDEVHGEGGDDTLHGDGVNDVNFGGATNDFIWGGKGNDIISGGPGEDALRGEGGADQIKGDDGFELVLLGGPGSDLFSGGENRRGEVDDFHLGIDSLI